MPPYGETLGGTTEPDACVQRLRWRGVTAPKVFSRLSACAEGRFRAAAAARRHTSPSRFACHLSSRRGFGPLRLRGKAPLEGSCHGVAMTERCYRTESFPQGFGVCKGRFRAAAAMRRHTSPSRFACHLSSRRGFGPLRLRGKAPLEGSWREAPERCYRTESFQQTFGVCRGRFRAAAAARRHTSPSRFACHLSSRRGFGPLRLRGQAPLEGSWREAPERCYRTESFPQGFGVCKGRFRAAAAMRRHTSPSRFACHLSSRRGFRALTTKNRLDIPEEMSSLFFIWSLSQRPAYSSAVIAASSWAIMASASAWEDAAAV